MDWNDSYIASAFLPIAIRLSSRARRRGWFAYVSLVYVKKLPDYAAFDKNVDRKSPMFTPPQSHPVIEARKPLLFIDLCWCREGESNPQDPKVGGF